MHCLHRKFIHTLHNGLVKAAATGCDALRPIKESLDIIVVQRVLVVELRSSMLMVVATRCGLGHRRHCARRQRGRCGARRGLVNCVTGSGKEQKKMNTLEFLIQNQMQAVCLLRSYVYLSVALGDNLWGRCEEECQRRTNIRWEEI